MGDNTGIIDDVSTLEKHSTIKLHIYYYLGIAYENSNNLNGARKAYQQAIEGGYSDAAKDLSELFNKMNKK